MKVDIIIDFSRYSDDQLATESQHVIDEMTGNASFPTPNPPLEDVIKTKNEFVTALVASKEGGRSVTLVKNQKRTALIASLRTLGIYVQANCKNDLNIALSSGFKTKKEPEPVGLLSKPQNIKVMPGPFPASLKVSIDPVKGASMYIYEWALTPVTDQTVWEYDLSKTSFIIKNLVPGKEYAIRVAAKGAAEGKVFSDIIVHYAA